MTVKSVPIFNTIFFSVFLFELQIATTLGYVVRVSIRSTSTKMNKHEGKHEHIYYRHPFNSLLCSLILASCRILFVVFVWHVVFHILFSYCACDIIIFIIHALLNTYAQARSTEPHSLNWFRQSQPAQYFIEFGL